VNERAAGPTTTPAITAAGTELGLRFVEALVSGDFDAMRSMLSAG
jgi:hypothetical protein